MKTLRFPARVQGVRQPNDRGGPDRDETNFWRGVINGLLITALVTTTLIGACMRGIH